jgi:hypothetical protein
MFIPDPDFCYSRIRILSIPDPKTATKERSGKKFVVHKMEKYFIFEFVKKKPWGQFTFIQKMSLISQKYRFGIPSPRSKRHRIPDP